MQITQRFFIEAGSHFASIAQFVAFIIAYKQRAEGDPFAMGFRIAANDQFLLLNTFELEPIPRTAMHVGAVGFLGDDTFPAFLAGLVKKPFPFVPMGDETD